MSPKMILFCTMDITDHGREKLPQILREAAQYTSHQQCRKPFLAQTKYQRFCPLKGTLFYTMDIIVRRSSPKYCGSQWVGKLHSMQVTGTAANYFHLRSSVFLPCLTTSVAMLTSHHLPFTIFQLLFLAQFVCVSAVFDN